jgi:hypothetical protein
MTHRAAALLSAALLAACGGKIAPPVPSISSEQISPAPDGGVTRDPLAEPVDAPLVLRFAYSLEEELSCSQSFENDGASARYELVLEPTGAAELTVRSDTSHAFGPSDARFRPGAEDETTREQSGGDQTWRGSFTWSGIGFSVALAPEEASCKTLVQGKGWYTAACAPAGRLSFACVRKTVKALVPFGKARDGAAPEALEDVEAFECAPAFGLPVGDAFDVELPASLPFAPAPGLELEYWRHGIGNFDRPKLRRVAPESMGDVRLE